MNNNPEQIQPTPKISISEQDLGEIPSVISGHIDSIKQLFSKAQEQEEEYSTQYEKSPDEDIASDMDITSGRIEALKETLDILNQGPITPERIIQLGNLFIDSAIKEHQFENQIDLTGDDDTSTLYHIYSGRSDAFREVLSVIGQGNLASTIEQRLENFFKRSQK